eukprot:TRINITY_DN61902_c0_g1_i1.p1 TRINITY_DN61902_c0_g1~~TRINITY_DN61902_c0_g1_i1.p1  ORF type:complete len:169 (+),score=33.33 TRINITY_DN61902_c0_g1_i1:19-525(+)
MASLIDGRSPENALYLGNYSKAKDRRFLNESNVRLVINVASEDAIVGQETHLYDRLFAELGIETLRFPWDDRDEYEDKLDAEDVRQAVLAMESHLSKGESVLLHCRQGKSRSGTLTVAYIMAKRQLNAEEALEFVKGRREVAHPNDGFRRWLQTHASMIQGMLEESSS